MFIGCKNKAIFDPVTCRRKTNLQTANYKVNNIIYKIEATKQIKKIIDKYPDIFHLIDIQITYIMVYNTILAQAANPPAFVRPRKLLEERHNATQAAFQKQGKSEITSLSNSDWASPLHMIPKDDGSY